MTRNKNDRKREKTVACDLWKILFDNSGFPPLLLSPFPLIFIAAGSSHTSSFLASPPQLDKEECGMREKRPHHTTVKRRRRKPLF